MKIIISIVLLLSQLANAAPPSCISLDQAKSILTEYYKKYWQDQPFSDWSDAKSAVDSLYFYRDHYETFLGRQNRISYFEVVTCEGIVTSTVDDQNND
jgi:hypothetical protein